MFSSGAFAAEMTARGNGEADMQARGGWRFGVGECALNNDRDWARVTVVGIEASGLYVLRFEDGPLAGQIGGNWSGASLAKLNGCGPGGFCAGNRVFNVDRDSAMAKIIGVQSNGTYVLFFQDGPLTRLKGGNWGAVSLAKAQGCGPSFCVGDRAYHIERDYAKVQVVGIQPSNLYVVHFLSGPLAGMRGGNWNARSLARAQNRRP